MLSVDYTCHLATALSVPGRGLGAQLASILYLIQRQPVVAQDWEEESVNAICMQLSECIDNVSTHSTKKQDSLQVLYDFFLQNDSDVVVFLHMLITIRKGAGDSLSTKHKQDLDYAVQILSCLRSKVVGRYEAAYGIYKIELGHNPSEIQAIKSRLQGDIKTFMTTIGMPYKWRFRYLEQRGLSQIYSTLKAYKSTGILTYTLVMLGLLCGQVLGSHLLSVFIVSVIVLLSFTVMSVYEVLFDYSESTLPGYVAQGIDPVELVVREDLPPEQYGDSSYTGMLSDISAS